MKPIAITTIGFVIAATAACQRQHDVKILLGPDAVTPSAGFLCRQDADPDKLLLQRGDVLQGGSFTASMVVDIVSLGGKLPGCRGEEIITACQGHSCTLTTTPADRYCIRVTFDAALASDRAALMAQITAQLEARPITTDAPNGPVLLRAVATSQTCDDLAVHPLDPALAVGCAYSCPAVLDDIAGPISLSLDVLTDQCESTVHACAAFPN
jgi:hypothetical protein